MGAGFSGLTAAYYLQQAGFSVEVMEKTARAGGVLETISVGGSGMVETAANAIINSLELEALCNTIGVQLVGYSERRARRRYIYRNGFFKISGEFCKEYYRLLKFFIFVLLRQGIPCLREKVNRCVVGGRGS